jgi:hypothetical protein
MPLVTGSCTVAGMVVHALLKTFLK